MSPVAPLPEGIAAVLPCNLLHHERL
jgi:hypothetical protein